MFICTFDAKFIIFPKQIGKGNVTANEIEKIKIALSYETTEKIKTDLTLAPAWIKEIFKGQF